MNIYSIENGYQKKLFKSFEDANIVFIEIAKEIVKKHMETSKDSFLDLNTWITVYNKETMFPECYLMPNLSKYNSLDFVIQWFHYTGPKHLLNTTN